MHTDDLQAWQHSHTFGQDLKRPGERRTLIVIALTGAMMVVEIIAGVLTGSMALLADGLHMASHAGALSLNAFAYVYARRHAHDENFSFGAGKVNALGGFTGAVLLALFALLMAWESVGPPSGPGGDHRRSSHSRGRVRVGGQRRQRLHAPGGRPHDHDDSPHAHHHDHNLKAAYLHVLADALTSLLAIVALLCAKYLGLMWMDPVVGIIGAILVSSWSLGLLRTTSGILLDKQGPKIIREGIRNSIEQDEDSQVTDLHLWSIGPNIYSVVLAVVAHDPLTPGQYKDRIPENLGLVHIAIEGAYMPGKRRRATAVTGYPHPSRLMGLRQVGSPGPYVRGLSVVNKNVQTAENGGRT